MVGNLRNTLNYDGLLKTRHAREGGYPDSLQLLEKTGFPIKDFGPTVGALSE
jgi:hypothetical protein